MKRLSYCILTLVTLVISAQAKIIVVNTTNNVAPGATETNLVQAINLLQDGDTIQFNIPGSGPHYLSSPPGGYPPITNINNVTIDGYSQPGSSPNANPILSSNNANITIVLDARNGNFTSFPQNIPGYGTGEAAILFVLGSTNFWARGICFLGVWDSNNGPDSYAVSFGGDQPSHGGHLSGCRVGLDLNGTTIARLKDAVTAFGSGPSDGIVVGVAPGLATPSAAAARAQFNVIVGEQIPVIIEGNGTHISGNFFNVFPDGIRDFLVDGGISGPDHTLEAMIEIGSYGDNVVIGTDGDGINDAEERNVFGGVIDADDHRILEWYGGTRTNNVIAGNYIGLAVDGKTVFTNGGPTMEVIEGFNSTTTVQVGSDLDGVSDDIEANHIYWNHPFDVLYPNPTDSSQLTTRWRFASLNAGARVSLRGNVLVNNDMAPYTYADGTMTRLDAFTNYFAPYLDTSTDIIPGLDPTNSVYPHLKGRFATGIDPYTNIIIDVYQLDREGWNNGMLFALPELTDNSSYTNGFSQGSKYLASFPVPNSGSFDLDLSDLDLGSGLVTLTVNYSADPPKTHHGRTHTSNFSNPGILLPGSVASVGLTTVVPDVPLWYNKAGNFVTNGPIKLNEVQNPATLSNWEPYISVVGDSTFLIGFNTFANDGTFANQNYMVAKQPATGGTPKLDYEFFDDSGAPFKGQINLSRQNGNPQRIAGDKRVGATNFITEAETSIGQLSAFQEVNRWTNNPIYQDVNRYCTEQIFSLDPATLVQTPVTNAWDYVYGPFTASSLGANNNAPQCSRTGGRPEFLDSGNIVVMIDDKNALISGAGEVTTFAIIKPDGRIIKGPTLVDPRDIWDNMAAYRGGFAIRVHDMLYFYDNNGNLQHTNDINVSSGLTFGTGREDASRIGSDIRSDYVYLAGQTPETSTSPVNVAIWDARTGQFVAKATVTDGDPAAFRTDRATIAVDALDQFCVVYVFQPTPDFAQQVVARVMAFDGTNITYVTHSFFPFMNSNNNATNGLNFTTVAPSVAMTTRQICIAAKGTINSTNNPAAGPDSPTETAVYTVIAQPSPSPGVPVITATKSGNNLLLSWSVDAGVFTVQFTPTLNPTSWTDVSPQPAIVQVGDVYQATVPISSTGSFFRLKR
jgi:hypothetical protein